MTSLGRLNKTVIIFMILVLCIVFTIYKMNRVTLRSVQKIENKLITLMQVQHDSERTKESRNDQDINQIPNESEIEANKKSCKEKGVLPNGGFCLDGENYFKGCANRWFSEFCEGFEEIVGHASIGDFGCGRGFYGGCFLRLNDSIITLKNEKKEKFKNKNFLDELGRSGIPNKPQVIRSWEGFEADPNVEVESKGLIKSRDLSKPFDLGYKFDWAMSIEVGEHIPKEGEQSFLDNLVRHACVGVALSWAVPGQGGYHHVNNQANSHIIRQMERRGLDHDLQAQNWLRKKVHYGILKRTLMIFRFPERQC